jgi:tetrahydromethanopterin S-methyltransferase subunit C
MPKETITLKGYAKFDDGVNPVWTSRQAQITFRRKWNPKTQRYEAVEESRTRQRFKDGAEWVYPQFASEVIQRMQKVALRYFNDELGPKQAQKAEMIEIDGPPHDHENCEACLSDGFCVGYYNDHQSRIRAAEDKREARAQLIQAEIEHRRFLQRRKQQERELDALDKEMARLERARENSNNNQTTDPVPPCYIVHFNVSVCAFVYWLANPSASYPNDHVGGTWIGSEEVQSTFSCMLPLAGDLIVGYLTDQHPTLAVLALLQIISVSSFFFSFDVEVFSFARALLQIGQTLILRSASNDDRTVEIARLSMSFGLGMLFGSFTARKFAEYAIASTSIATAFSVAMIVANFCFSASKRSDKTKTKNNNEKAKCWTVCDLVSLAVLFSIPAIFEPVFRVLMLDKYYFSRNAMEWFVSFLIGISVLSLSFQEIAAALSIVTVTVTGVAIAHLQPSNVLNFAGLFALSNIASSALYFSSFSHILFATEPQYLGRTVAITRGLRNVVGLAVPSLGSWLFERYGGVRIDCRFRLFGHCWMNE